MTEARVDFLHEGWTLTALPAGSVKTVADLPKTGWSPAIVPGTVAQSLGLDVDSARDLDAEDWWYRCTFKAAPGARQRLRFEGLATLAEAWLNGERILSSRNMFLPQTCEVGKLMKAENELVLCFRALGAELAAKRPRPRWKTALVTSQNLRWVRTTLLGRIPGWTPTLAPVGPWKAITLETPGPIELRDLDLQTRAEGSTGHLRIRAALGLAAGVSLLDAEVEVGTTRFPVGVSATLDAAITLPNAPLWWPHTHGTPTLLPCTLHVKTSAGEQRFDLGPVGFKTLRMDRSEGHVQLEVNGRPLFCRGACWTVDDVRSLTGDPASLRTALELAKAAGFNLLRVIGTMTYESDAFYALCDELGILLWQDFMFANMDYPFDDAAFRAAVDLEVDHQLRRLQRHPSVAVLCGGSEVAQQAAMLGLPASEWLHPFFTVDLPARCAELAPGLPYFPSSPCEGALPFHVGTGIAHYYGVGAYLRPLTDVKHAGVKFTTECLGFSQVPEDDTLELLMDGAIPPPHHPRWKAGVPRDNGAGWDFEDVRDHYLREFFRLDPVALRSFDPERYRRLSRLVTGEVLARVFAEWRRPGSGCGGALVWFFKDLRPGAGWGLLDSTNRPKAAYWFLKRALAPQALNLTDEGLDGVKLHLHNETDLELEATVELKLLQGGRTRIAQASAPVRVPAFGALSFEGDALLGSFADTTYAYRFGPPKHEVVIARMKDASGRVLSEDFLFPSGHDLPVQEARIEASAEVQPDGSVLMTLASDAFLQGLSLSCKGFRPEDDHFHLAPDQPKVVRFRPMGSTPFKVHVEALNLRAGLTVRV